MTSFPEFIFKLNCLTDISQYWSELQCICLNTRLGLLRGKGGKQIEAEDSVRAPKSFRPTRSLMSLKEIQVKFVIVLMEGLQTSVGVKS